MDFSGLVIWPAPAKLNRFLHILGRRADGYHELQTVFQFLEQHDQLRFYIRSDSTIEQARLLTDVAPEHDLCLRAAKLLQKMTGCRQGVTILLDKTLPMGAGLGGGSSDAATTLIALNYYWQTGLTITELVQLGLQLGADVPVFIYGQAAWAEGVGEHLTPLPDLDQPWFVVLTPACFISTKAVFSDPALTRDAQALTIRALITEDDRNDCEAVVYRRHPEVARAARWLNQYAKARLSGTGSSVFAAFDNKQQATQVLSQKPAELAGFVSRGHNTSLLHHFLLKGLHRQQQTARMHS